MVSGTQSAQGMSELTGHCGWQDGHPGPWLPLPIAPFGGRENYQILPGFLCLYCGLNMLAVLGPESPVRVSPKRLALPNLRFQADPVHSPTCIEMATQARALVEKEDNIRIDDVLIVSASIFLSLSRCRRCRPPFYVIFAACCSSPVSLSVLQAWCLSEVSWTGFVLANRIPSPLSLVGP